MTVELFNKICNGADENRTHDLLHAMQIIVTNNVTDNVCKCCINNKQKRIWMSICFLFISLFFICLRVFVFKKV